jgi:geranylgeranyl diphosphate synthase type II
VPDSELQADTPISERLERWARCFDERFDALLRPVGETLPEIVEAMRYSALAGGKRLRPFLVTRCCELCGGYQEDALPAAAAIECVHTFSLVHDDLPAMDNDDLRRGRPTNHKVFGEAMAILAGDGLLTLAFELIAREMPPTSHATTIMLELARGTGWCGMIGGQVADMLGENHPSSRELVESIHVKKTAKLFEAACRMGAWSGGGHIGETGIAGGKTQSNKTPSNKTSDGVEILGQFGLSLGRAFQIADDLLDVDSSADVLGKSAGKDAKSNKQTYPAAFGVDESRAIADRLVEEAISTLSVFDSEADDLRDLARFVVDRRS